MHAKAGEKIIPALTPPASGACSCPGSAAASVTSVAPEEGGDTAAYAVFARALLAWFKENRRDLPWRRTYTPYHVWVSEIMLQQTQMERGVAYFNRWMERFPTLASVAKADIDSVQKAWEGLGYYSRAKNLHATAKHILHSLKGEFPHSAKELEKLPGIGEYTAGAIASIAFNEAVPAVDANVERVFARVFDVAMPCKSPVAAGFIRNASELCMACGTPREWNQAVMEFGALVCKKKPLCEACPVQGSCQARRLGIIHERPLPGKRVAATSLQVVTGVLAHGGRIFLQRRLNTGVWAGLWEFPGGRLEQGEGPEQAIVREFLEETAYPVRVEETLGVVTHAYTRYRITLTCFFCTLPNSALCLPEPVLTAASEYRWVLPQELDNYALPAAHRKLADMWAGRIADFAGKTGEISASSCTATQNHASCL